MDSSKRKIWRISTYLYIYKYVKFGSQIVRKSLKCVYILNWIHSLNWKIKMTCEHAFLTPWKPKLVVIISEECFDICVLCE